MNYHGLPVKEMVGAKVIYYDKPISLLCWNDTPDGTLPVLVEEWHNVILFNPSAKENRVVTLNGKTYQHCAEIPKDIDESRMATCEELLGWLDYNRDLFIGVLGKSSKDLFKEIRCVKLEDYKPSAEVMSKPCNDNGVFNVIGIMFLGKQTLDPMKPSVNNLLYGVEGIYEPDAERIALNEDVFARTYSIVITEHLAVSHQAVRYGFGKFSSKAIAESVKDRIITILCGTPDGAKDIYIVPTASIAGLSRMDCGDMGDTCGIPQYLDDAYTRASNEILFTPEMDPKDLSGKNPLKGFAVKVNTLRARTERSLGKCRDALLATQGDMDKAEALLRDMAPVSAH